MDRQDISFKQNYIHPEEEPNVAELNELITSAKKDILYLDNSITETSNNFNNLLLSTRAKLLNIKDLLNAERERQQDINILCNKFSEFSSTMNLYAADFTGNLTFRNEILQAASTLNTKVPFTVDSIEGNGFLGNKYVYLNNSFLEKVLDTSNFNNITDNNLATSFEYSRITVNSNEEAPSAFNKDSIEAECYITLHGKELFNHIEISSDRNDLILKEVYSSLDGLTYALDREYNISINLRSELYNDSTYVYGSGIITVNPTNYVKLVFRSNGHNNDELAYSKVFYKNDSIVKKIVKVESANRHIIKLNDISLYKNTYKKGMTLSKELITTPVKSIAIYCNEYINKDYSIKNAVNYYLILNGKEYKVEPINSNRDGKKIAKMSSQAYESEYAIYLNEKIKSAKLKIVANVANTNITPYISDIKILIGGA